METGFKRRCAFPVPVLLAVLASSVALAAPPQDAAIGSKLSPANANFDLKEEGLKALWRQDIVHRASKKLRTVYFTGSMVVAETEQDEIVCIDAEDGNWKESTVLRRTPQFPPVDAGKDELLIVIADTFYRYDVAADELTKGWRCGMALLAPPRIARKYVILGDASGRVMSVRLSNGDLHWSSAVLGGPIIQKPAVQADTVFVAAAGDRVMAMELTMGGALWNWQPNPPGKVSSGLAVDREHVYVGDTNGVISALRVGSGRIDWQVIAGMPVIGQPRLQGQNLLALLQKPAVTCVRMGDKPRVLWTWDGATRLLAASPKAVYVLTGENVLVGLSMETGQELWRDNLPADCKVTGNPEEPVIYIGNTDGFVVAFGEVE